MDGPKPGYRTTEFWITIVVAIVGALESTGLFLDDSPVGKGLALISSALVVLGYGISRGIAKGALTKSRGES